MASPHQGGGMPHPHSAVPLQVPQPPPPPPLQQQQQQAFNNAPTEAGADEYAPEKYSALMQAASWIHTPCVRLNARDGFLLGGHISSLEALFVRCVCRECLEQSTSGGCTRLLLPVMCAFVRATRACMCNVEGATCGKQHSEHVHCVSQ